MIIDRIKEGDEVTTMFGFLLIGKENGAGLIDCVEFEVDRDGEEHEGDECRLVATEIAQLMKEVDGKNHSVIYERDEEE